MQGIKIFNATELWQQETSLPTIPTFSQSFDNMLGNDGIQLGSITELLGLPGSGKTQLCLQLCASVQVPKELGGLDAEALYIDTNTNFTLSRFRDTMVLNTKTKEHLKNKRILMDVNTYSLLESLYQNSYINDNNNHIEVLGASLTRCQNILDVPLKITEDDALKRLHYVNAFGLEKYCALMYRLPKLLEDYPNVKLIVIDSIAYPFKDGVPTNQRTGILFRQMAELQRIAIQKRIAAVLTNEMSTRVGLVGGPMGGSAASVVGALGDAWAHRCNVRVLLSTPQYCRDSTQRLAALLKSNVATTAVASFQITSEGIRDVERNTE